MAYKAFKGTIPRHVGQYMEILEDLLDAHDLRIRYFKGNSDKLVVVFCGVGTKPSQHPPIEMFASATQGKRHHTIFVTDGSRSWLNKAGHDILIASSIHRVAKQIAPSSVTLVGNSMGATLALLMSNLIPCDAVLAISPQYSVHPAIVPEELRWMRFRKRIEHFPYPFVADLDPSNKIIQIVHGDSEDELVHALRFSQMQGLRHYILPGMDHNLIKTFKNDRVLDRLLKHAINQRPRRFRGVLERYDVRFRSEYERSFGNAEVRQVQVA